MNQNQNIKIAITGGKGGTGKSTVATAIAFFLAKNKKVLLIDSDVDCPSDDILLGLKLKKVKDVSAMIPKFNLNKCIKCGKCAKICPEKAIIQPKGKHPIFISSQCIGCRACKIICPTGVISESKQKIGEILIDQKGKLTLLSGKMNIGIEESSLIVNELKKVASNQKESYDYIITDTAAGTHCPVIAALSDNDLAFAVTEPTPLGSHDLDLILTLTKKLNIKTKIILNRSDIGPKKIIESVSKKHQVKIIAEIPYSKKIEQSYANSYEIEINAIKNIIENINK